MPDLDLIWRACLHRFDVEHGYRFAKTALGWDKATLREPDQVSRWTWLILCGLTQLRLARPIAEDHRQRWERRRKPGRSPPDASAAILAAWPPSPARRPARQNPPGQARADPKDAPASPHPGIPC